MSDCVICGRKETRDGLCSYHTKALENVKTTYEQWQIALGIEWEEYLDLVYEEEGLGRWAREVIDYLMQQNGS